jgi:hypothetical protein
VAFRGERSLRRPREKRTSVAEGWSTDDPQAQGHHIQARRPVVVDGEEDAPAADVAGVRRARHGPKARREQLDQQQTYGPQARL